MLKSVLSFGQKSTQNFHVQNLQHKILIIFITPYFLCNFFTALVRNDPLALFLICLLKKYLTL